MWIILVIFLIVVIRLKMWYCEIIQTYFMKDIYDYFIELIHVVADTNFMNYGLWKHPADTLKIANRRMCKFIYDKARLKESNLNVLDVGCGYGSQDFYWQKRMHKKSIISAVDISNKQITNAREKRELLKISPSSLKFIQGDAHELLEYFKENEFDRIISLESAFHYKNKNLFFTNANKLIKQGGIFIITDIVLSPNYKNNIFNKFFLKLACDFLCIPESNLYSPIQWKLHLNKAGFKIEEFHDVSSITFLPYYKHFFTTFVEKRGWPLFVADVAYYLAETNQLFSYVIAVCSK